MTAPWLQTASGRAFDLIDPKAASVDFAVDIPEALARIPRFTGHAGAYSVAQHCVLGAESLFEESGRPDFAAAFLLHDGHEYVLGDEATPIAEAHVEIARQMFGDKAAEIVRAARRELKRMHDVALHARAGIVWPLAADVQAAVKKHDLRMLRTERDHLMVRPPRAWAEAVEAAEPVRMKGAIKVWPWLKAVEEYRARLRRWCPAALGEG